MACTEPVEPERPPKAEPEPHADARERLAAAERASRESIDFAAIPASDGRFGADPYQLIAAPDGRIAGLLRGADQVVLFDPSGAELGVIATVHDPTDLAWRGDELLVVGPGEPRIARYRVGPMTHAKGEAPGAEAGVAETFEPLAPIELPAAFGPRAIVVSPDEAVLVADEAGRLHLLRGPADDLAPVAEFDDHCRGPLALEVCDDRLLSVCLVDHRVRIDRLAAGTDALVELGAITHDGPIWSLAVGGELDGERLLALTGVEDHPLDRSDGGFGYIDSFLFLYALGPDGATTQRAAINVSEIGVVTPKWSRFIDAATPTLELAGYATPALVQVRFDPEHWASPRVDQRGILPGTTAAVGLRGGALLLANPLFDGWMRVGPDSDTELLPVADPRDDRSFDERLGEALLFTTAMAPWNDAVDQHSRFTCETCHFEGRGDGRLHYTGRERDGVRVHATSKPLLGLFPNRPHFSRALDKTTAKMIDNEFRVANRHSGREPWFTLTAGDLPWLATIPGWPGEVDGERLRLAVMAFLQRFSTPSNPATRGRDHYTELERAGATEFARHCETCHQARLVTDDPSTRIAEPEWERVIFSANAPIVWASDDYAATEIEPWVHADGARVPSLRRLYVKSPYFTNGSARGLEQVLAGVREIETGVTHGAPPIDPDQQLDAPTRAALLAFLRLL